MVLDAAPMNIPPQQTEEVEEESMTTMELEKLAVTRMERRIRVKLRMEEEKVIAMEEEIEEVTPLKILSLPARIPVVRSRKGPVAQTMTAAVMPNMMPNMTTGTLLRNMMTRVIRRNTVRKNTAPTQHITEEEERRLLLLKTRVKTVLQTRLIGMEVRLIGMAAATNMGKAARTTAASTTAASTISTQTVGMRAVSTPTSLGMRLESTTFPASTETFPKIGTRTDIPPEQIGMLEWIDMLE